MHEPETLVRLQRRFWAFIVAPSGVKKAMASIAENDPGSVPIQNWLQASSEEMAIERLDIYANAYFYRLHDILANQYETMFEVLGPPHFHNVLVDYLLAHPSQNPSVDYIGRALPEFLREHPAESRPPWLAELAQLEWQFQQLVCASDSPTVTEGMLKEFPPEEWGSLRFRAVAAHAMVHLEYPVHQIHRAVRRQEAPPRQLEKSPTTVLLWRQGFRLLDKVLSAHETLAFQHVQAEKPFEEICVCFLPQSDHAQIRQDVFQVAVQEAYNTLSSWLTDGLLAQILPPT